jgi:hypothetical protein
LRAEPLFHARDQGFGAGRAANEDPLERRQIAAILLEPVHHAEPDGRNPYGHGDGLLAHQAHEAVTVELAAGQDQPGPGCGHRERQPPAVGVEHRNGEQQGVARGDGECVGLERAQGVEIVRAVRVEHAPRIAGGARGVAKAGGSLLGEIAPAVGRTLPRE